MTINRLIRSEASHFLTAYLKAMTGHHKIARSVTRGRSDDTMIMGLVESLRFADQWRVERLRLRIIDESYS